MRSSDRATARRQLDKRLTPLRDDPRLIRPPRGWIKAIREALGMTTKQMGKRLGVSQPRAVAIEKAELNGSITMDSLEKAAHALDCTLVYALVPRKSLDDLIYERARQLAMKRLAIASHSMELEAQSVDSDDQAEQLKELIRQLLEKNGAGLWEEQ